MIRQVLHRAFGISPWEQFLKVRSMREVLKGKRQNTKEHKTKLFLTIKIKLCYNINVSLLDSNYMKTVNYVILEQDYAFPNINEKTIEGILSPSTTF